MSIFRFSVVGETGPQHGFEADNENSQETMVHNDVPEAHGDPPAKDSINGYRCLHPYLASKQASKANKQAKIP